LLHATMDVRPVPAVMHRALRARGVMRKSRFRRDLPCPARSPAVRHATRRGLPTRCAGDRICAPHTALARAGIPTRHQIFGEQREPTRRSMDPTTPPRAGEMIQWAVPLGQPGSRDRRRLRDQLVWRVPRSSPGQRPGAGARFGRRVAGAHQERLLALLCSEAIPTRARRPPDAGPIACPRHPGRHMLAARRAGISPAGRRAFPPSGIRYRPLRSPSCARPRGLREFSPLPSAGRSRQSGTQAGNAGSYRHPPENARPAPAARVRKEQARSALTERASTHCRAGLAS
jgi:hypothetical protein